MADTDRTADTEKETSNSKLGLLSKLLLWGLVLLFGYLYLNAMNRGGDFSKDAGVASAPTPPVNSEPTVPASGVTLTDADAAAEAPPSMAAPAEPLPVAQSRTIAGDMASAPAPGTELGASRAEAEAFAMPMSSEEAPSEQVTVGPAASTQTPAGGRDEEQAPAPRQLPPAQPVRGRPAYGNAEIEWLRNEYEALRRQAMDEARERWQQMYRMRPAMPMPRYYGPPGYYFPRPAPAPVQGD